MKNRNSLLSVLIGLSIGFFSFLFVLTLVSIIALTLLFHRYWPVANQIRQASDLTWLEVLQLATELSKVEPRKTNMTWLILGTDQLAERGENQPIFTDTIMLVQIDPIDQSVTLLSIPRDVWLPDPSLKINTIYQNNLIKFNNACHPGLDPGSSNLNSNEGFEMLNASPRRGRQVQHDKAVDYCIDLQNTTNQLARQQTLLDFSQIFDIPIDQLLIVDMELVPQLIDALGGVEVNVKTAFIDYAYPRSNVDVTIERDPNKLYETVSFEAGPVKLDGQTALKFMRSRKAQNSEGNDLARANRQQQVISALIDQLMTSMPLQSVDQIINYLNLYQNSLADQLPLTELLKIVVSLPNSPLDYSFKTASLPVIPIDQDGVLFESPRHYSGQWVFEMTSLENFQNAIRNQLGSRHSGFNPESQN